MAVNSAKTAKSWKWKRPVSSAKKRIQVVSSAVGSAATHPLINAMFLSNGGVRATEAVLSVASLFLFSHMNKSPEKCDDGPE